MSQEPQHHDPDWLQPQQHSPAGKARSRRQKSYTPHMVKPRLPTEAEKQELLDYLVRTGQTTEDQRSNLGSLLWGENSMVAVFDNYQTYGGEYTGKVLVIMRDIDQRGTEVFLWQNGRIVEADKVFTQARFYRRRRK